MCSPQTNLCDSQVYNFLSPYKLNDRERASCVEHNHLDEKKGHGDSSSLFLTWVIRFTRYRAIIVSPHPFRDSPPPRVSARSKLRRERAGRRTNYLVVRTILKGEMRREPYVLFDSKVSCFSTVVFI